MKILITGGAGYLGSIMTPYLLGKGHEVTVLDNFLFRQNSLADCCQYDTFSIVRGDCRDTDNIKPLLTHVDTAVQGINRIIEKEGETLFQDARKVTNDLSALVGLMAERVPRIADDIEEFASKMNVTADQFQKLMTPANREKMENAISNLDATSAKVDAMLDSINTLVEDIGKLVINEDGDVKKTLSETRYFVESVSRHIDSINQNMEGAARNMYEFTRQIRQNPGLLLGSEPPEDKSKSQ